MRSSLWPTFKICIRDVYSPSLLPITHCKVLINSHTLLFMLAIYLLCSNCAYNFKSVINGSIYRYILNFNIESNNYCSMNNINFSLNNPCHCDYVCLFIYQHCPGCQKMPIMLIIMDSSLIRVQYDIIVCRLFIGEVLTMSTNQTLEYDCTNPYIRVWQWHAWAGIRSDNIPVSVCC